MIRIDPPVFCPFSLIGRYMPFSTMAHSANGSTDSKKKKKEEEEEEEEKKKSGKGREEESEGNCMQVFRAGRHEAVLMV